LQRGNHRPTARPREAGAFAAAEGQRRKAGRVAELLRHQLVERQTVPERPATCARGTGEEALLRRVPTIHTGQRNTGKYRCLRAVRLEHLKIRNPVVVAPIALREEELRHDAHVRYHSDESAERGWSGFGSAEARQHAFNKRQR